MSHPVSLRSPWQPAPPSSTHAPCSLRPAFASGSFGSSALALTVSACSRVYTQRAERHTPAIGRHLLGESLARAIPCCSLNEQMQCNRRVTSIGADHLVNLVAVKCVAVAVWYI